MRRFYHVALLVASLLLVLGGPAWAEGTPSAEIHVRDKNVLALRAARGGRTAEERAKAANQALEALLAHPEELGDVSFDPDPATGTAVVMVGKTPIVTLGQEDVDVTGDASVSVLAGQVTASLEGAIATERKRSAIATTVFSVSVLVFSALVAFLILGRIGEVATRLRATLTDDPDRITAVRVGKVELLSAGSGRGALSIALTVGHRLIQLAIVYGWLIFGLSLFEVTAGYTKRLTGLVIKPLYGLAERVGGALPMLVVAVIAVFAVSVLVRFVGLFFESVERGDTRILWLPRDLARSTSVVLRFGIVIAALVLASPLLTGESDGALSRTGIVALIAVALASVPLLASAIVGTAVVFGRRYKRGERVEIGDQKGRVLDVNLLAVRLEDDGFAEVSVPHLLALVRPTRLHRHAPLSTIDVVVDASAPQQAVETALFDAARRMSSRGHVELVHLDARGAHWRVTSASMRHDVSLGAAVQEALATIEVGLGRKDEP